MESSSLTVPGILMTAVSVLAGVVAKLWAKQTERYEEELRKLREQLEQERADRKAAEKELAQKSELFLKALTVKRGENSRVSEPPSQIVTGAKTAQ